MGNKIASESKIKKSTPVKQTNDQNDKLYSNEKQLRSFESKKILILFILKIQNY